MHNRRDHLGTRFEVRTDRWTWFWCLINPPLNRGAAGAAATEADAVREACTAIEEMSTPASSLRCAGEPLFDSAGAYEAHRRMWTGLFDRVAEYLPEAV